MSLRRPAAALLAAVFVVLLVSCASEPKAYPPGESPCRDVLSRYYWYSEATQGWKKGVDPTGEVVAALRSLDELLEYRSGVGGEDAAEYDRLAAAVRVKLGPLIEVYEDEDLDTPYLDGPFEERYAAWRLAWGDLRVFCEP